MKLLLFVLIAAILAITCTLLTVELIAFAGLPRNGFVSLAICCIWLIVVYGILQKQAERAER
jgi:predicted membrane channel-forming protein YqfA (hemolysin III family)